ncbi:hypothetical protein A2715_02390 [Candidatus Woesebacteria bacterium RIFCSPHIGHO2_01_FULL_39_32]|nr:MAG: hypothetical protein A2715_02390 [Candidatus Woesebacteria bacterium RIFCSPHIGHO2_01_FULL_39_32]
MKNEKPFKGKKVYFSNTVTGMPDTERDFGWKLVQFMKENGADVLSDFVGARNKKEHIRMFLDKTGFDREKEPNPWFFVRKTDTKFVDEATHVVAVVNGPSYGVGMEIERAILKPQRRLDETPILCLVREDLLRDLSFMIRGVSKKEAPKFQLKIYKNISEAKKLINEFLSIN